MSILLKTKIYQEAPYSIWRDRNRIKLIIGLPTLILLFSMLFVDELNNRLTGAILIIFIFCWLILRIAQFGINRISTSTGSNLIFHENKIEIDRETIFIEDIKTITFDIVDHNGKLKYRSPNDLTPFLSQGFNNKVDIEVSNGQFYSLKFQIDRESDITKIKPLILNLVNHDLINKKLAMSTLNIKTQ